MIDILHIDPTPDAHTFHVVHPRGVPFSALINSAASWLNVRVVPFPEWRLKFSEQYKAQSYSDASLRRAQSDNPALRLFDFYASARTGSEWEPFGLARLDTSRAARASKVLAERAKPLGEENVREWMGAWSSSGFLPPNGRRV